jgi:putative ABC transport system permease protein
MRNALATVTLALGIGASTAIFSFLNPLLLHPLIYPSADQLVTIESRDPKGNAAPVSYPDFRDWSAQKTTLTDLAAFDIGFFQLTDVNEPEEIPGALVTPNLFPMLGVTPSLGRVFREGEEGVVILSQATWKRRFGSDPAILGKSIALDFSRTPQVERFTVIGVMPPNFWMYYGNFEVFVPLARNVIRDDRKARILTAIGRLKPGTQPEQAQSSLSATGTDKDWGVLVRSWEERVRRPVRSQWIVLAAGAGLLLIIASANVAGLLLVRAHARRREMAIRAALGASPARLFRLCLSEASRLGAVAAVLGIAIAFACVKLMTALLPPDIELTRMLPGIDRVTIDPAAFVFGVTVAMVSCLAGATYPAWKIRTVDPIKGLKDGAIQSRTGRAILITAEVALAVLLLSGAGLLIKTLDRIRSIDLGFRPEHLLVLRVPPAASNSSPSYYTELVARVAALPGVESVALMSSITGRPRNGFQIPGTTEKFAANDQIVDPAYFATLRIPLRRGRFFDEADRRRVVINESLARHYFPDRDPVGRSILVDGDSLEILGVAADMRPRPFRDPSPLVYQSTRDGAHAAQMVIRTASEPVSFARSVTAVVRDLGGVVAEVGSMQHFIENDTWQQQQAAALMGAFAAIALVLASVGLYGVVSFAVARRTREIGIRMAIGARPHDVTALVLAETARPVAIGLAIGLIATLAAGRLLAALLYQVTPSDPAVLAAVAVLIAIAAFAASLRPLRRALTIDPNTALRLD